VKRLVVIETEEMYKARKLEAANHRALRPPLVVSHLPATTSSESNFSTLTFDGIDVMGNRLQTRRETSRSEDRLIFFDFLFSLIDFLLDLVSGLGELQIIDRQCKLSSFLIFSRQIIRYGIIDFAEIARKVGGLGGRRRRWRVQWRCA
ncbi:hypothetical protein U1Q18_010859, partial [Sarracenia purpurea var. burkii]